MFLPHSSTNTFLFLPVAFSVAFAGTDRSLNIGENAAIRFNVIVTNIGDGYNSLDGHFTAPLAGVYAFYFSMRTLNDHSWLLVAIYKGNRQLAYATAEGQADTWDRGSIFVTTHVDKGDVVYARRTSGGGSTYLEGGMFTTFSGVLISPD